MPKLCSVMQNQYACKADGRPKADKLKAADRNHLIASVAGTLELLEVFSQKPGPLPLGAFVEATKRPKSSVHRMLATLMNLGFVEQVQETGKYRLTLKLWRLGMPALADLDILKVSRPHLEALMAAADETVHLAVLDPSGSVVYVAKVESPRSIRVQTQVGKLNPAWCTATGRSLLAFHPAQVDKILSQPLKPLTPKTVTDPQRIRALLAEVAARGYAVTKGENHPEMGGIAAPIRDHTGQVTAACGVAIPVFRMDEKLVQRCIPLVMKTACAISSALGYQSQQQRKLRHGT